MNEDVIQRRWTNQEYLEGDIRKGWSFVFTETGEIISRPASNNKRAFLLQYKDEKKEFLPPSYIDSIATEANDPGLIKSE